MSVLSLAGHRHYWAPSKFIHVWAVHTGISVLTSAQRNCRSHEKKRQKCRRFATLNSARLQWLHSFVQKSHNRTVYFKNRNKIWRDREATSAPQSHGLVAAAGCQKWRRRVERHRRNEVSVIQQSRHTSRRRVVGGQQPQSHGLVVGAGCQKQRRRVKRDRPNRVAVPRQSRHTRHSRFNKEMTSGKNRSPVSERRLDRPSTWPTKQPVSDHGA